MFKNIFCTITVFSASLMLIGCASTPRPKQKTPNPILKKQKTVAMINPTEVHILRNPLPANIHYKKLGEVHANAYNAVGVKRQQAVINDILIEKAAKKGGNAVIIKKTKYASVGAVIQFPA